MVLNGSEIGGGSIRIHDPAMQSQVFSLLGIGEEEAQETLALLREIADLEEELGPEPDQVSGS